MRVVSGAGGGSGGSMSPIRNDVVPSHIHAFSGNEMGAHTHTDSGHSHTYTTVSGSAPQSGNSTWCYNSTGAATTGTSHANISSNSAGTPSGTIATNDNASTWTPRYIDMIICSKN